MKALKITILALALALSACNSNPFGKPSGDPTATPEAPATPPPTDNSGAGGGGEEPPPGPSFEMMKANIFNRNTCTRCHGDFEDYATVVENLGEIRTRINSAGPDRMPPSRSLSAEQKQLLDTWIELGSPQ